MFYVQSGEWDAYAWKQFQTIESARLFAKEMAILFGMIACKDCAKSNVY